MITKVFKGEQYFEDGEFATIVGNRIKYLTKAHPQPIYAQVQKDRVYLLKDGVPGDILAVVDGVRLTSSEGIQVCIKGNHVYHGPDANPNHLVATFEGEHAIAAAAATLLLLRIDFRFKK